MSKNNKITILTLLLGCLLAACSPAKHCAAPELNLPNTFDQIERDSITIADLEWWSIYTDTILQNLIHKTLLRNKDMLIAAEKVEEMRHLHRIDRSSLAPSLDLKLGGDHEWTNPGGEGGIDALVSDPEITAKLDLAWEIDLWGGLTWKNRQGAAKYLASVEAQRAMRMTLVAEVATAYFQLIALDNQLLIVQQTLKTREESVELAKLRFDGGITSETSYQQAKVELATTAAAIPDLKRKIAIKESQIALLAGSYPTAIERRVSKVSMIKEDELPIGLPAQLVLRRPDLQQAEARLRAAEAAVGVAQANRLPKLTINLAAGLENDEWKAFLRSPLFYTAGNIVAPLFDFGKRKAQFEAAVAVYNQEKLAYEKAVLVAFKEVYDAVVTYRSARENTVLMRNLRDATQKYVDLARLQYMNGVIRYIDVLDAQRKNFTASIDLSNAITQESIAFVSLYKALGGGWQ